MSGPGVVVALSLEARTLGRPIRRSDGLYTVRDGPLVAIGGVGPAAAGAAALRLVAAGATSLVSWGLAGGLDPQLPAGTLCLPTRVLGEDGASHATNSDWRELVAAAVAPRIGIATGLMLTSGRALDAVAAKAAAFARTGALAVDMESSAVAQVAAAHGLPFVVIRAIVDTAGDALPDAAAAATQHGRVRMARLLLALARRPGDLPALVRLARRYARARRALLAVARTGVLAPVAWAVSAANRIA